MTERVCRPLQRSKKYGCSKSGYFLGDGFVEMLLEEVAFRVRPEKSGRVTA